MSTEPQPASPSPVLPDQEAKFRGHKHLLAAAACAIIAFIWLWRIGDVFQHAFETNAKDWFGQEWFKVPDWIHFTWIFATFILPISILAAYMWYSLTKLESSNRSLIHRSNLKDLSKARFALQQGLSSLDKIESEYKFKIASFEALQKQLDELASVKEVNVAELQKKLNAIALASRHKVWAGRIAAFALGILSSLFSSYLWDVLSK